MVAFAQVNLVVRDMDASVAFYRRLGLDIDAEPGAEHVSVRVGDARLDLDHVDFAAKWDSRTSGGTGGTTVLGFDVETREDVDRLYRELTDAGYPAHQPPYDAFWGARYAIVDDPDGNPVGLMSPIDQDRKFWPPGALPHA